MILQQQSQYPDCTRTTKHVTPLESSYSHHRPARVAFARAPRGRCFGPKPETTAPGCRTCSRESMASFQLSGWAMSDSFIYIYMFAATKVRIFRYMSCQSDLAESTGRWLTSTKSSLPNAVARVPG